MSKKDSANEEELELDLSFEPIDFMEPVTAEEERKYPGLSVLDPKAQAAWAADNIDRLDELVRDALRESASPAETRYWLKARKMVEQMRKSEKVLRKITGV